MRVVPAHPSCVMVCVMQANIQAHRRATSMIELILVVGIMLVLIALAASAVQRARESAALADCQHRLQELSRALHQFQNVIGNLPAGVRVQNGSDPYLYMTWHTQLLPFLEQEALWKETTAAFAQAPNFQTVPPHIGLGKPMRAFSCPDDYRATSPQKIGQSQIERALTSYLGVEGTRSFFEDGVLFVDSAVRFSDIRDGQSCTLIVGERPASADLRLGWWYGGSGQGNDGEGDSVLGTRTKNYHYQSQNCPVGPYHFIPGRLDNQCDAFHFWSLHPGGANFLFVDGHVSFLSYSADSILPALGTRAGGEAVQLPD
jgi:prepilin-type processing-associated H-X9-DG protein